MKSVIKYIPALLIVVCLTLTSRAQEPKINYSSKGFSLSKVLEDLSLKYRFRFAYDAELFQKIETNFELKDKSIGHFLELINADYKVNSKLIEGTWILIPEKEELIVDVETNHEPPKPIPVTVSGYVKNAFTGDNLLYCNVVTDDYRGGMTNALGFFSIDIPETDSARIMISHLGFRKLDTMISTQNSALIFLEPLEIMIEAIQVIHEEKQVLQATPHPDKIGFNPAKSSDVPRISNDDMANALLIIPGVNFFHGSTAGISIRGSAPNDNLVLFDGIPVLETNHLLGNMSVLNSKYVQQAFVSRGGFDAEFGGRVAGIVELKGKSGKNNRPYLDVSANLLNTNVLVNLPVTDKFSLTTAWRRSFTDQWQNYLFYRLVDDVSPDADNENVVTSTLIPTIKYQDLNAKLSLHPSENIEFNLNILYGSDFQSRDFELFNTKEYYRNEMVKSENKGLSFNWNWQINKFWYSSFSAGYSKLDKEIIDETGELEEVTEIIDNPGQGKGKGKGLAKTKEKTYTRFVYDIDNGENDIEEFRISWKTELKTGKLRNRFGAGWSANSYSYDFYANRTRSEFPIDSIIKSADQYLMNAYLQQNLEINQKVNLRWGIRADIDLVTRKTYWQPRGGVEVSPSDGVKFNLSSGIYHQYLSSVKRIDSEGYFNPVWYLPGMDGSGIVKAYHHIVGLKLDKNGWFVNVEGYLKNSNGKINLFAEPVNRDDQWSIVYLPRKSNERSKGIDLFIQKKNGVFNHMVGYSLAKTEEQIDGVFNENWIPGYNDRLHRLKITEMVTWKNWTLTGSLNYSSGLPITNFTNEQFLQNNIRTDYLSQLDFSLSKKIQTKHFITTAGVSLLNVFNRKNVVEVDFLRFTSDTESLTVRSDISALEFTPLFFMNFLLR